MFIKFNTDSWHWNSEPNCDLSLSRHRASLSSWGGGDVFLSLHRNILKNRNGLWLSSRAEKTRNLQRTTRGMETKRAPNWTHRLLLSLSHSYINLHSHPLPLIAIAFIQIACLPNASYVRRYWRRAGPPCQRLRPPPRRSHPLTLSAGHRLLRIRVPPFPPRRPRRHARLRRPRGRLPPRMDSLALIGFRPRSRRSAADVVRRQGTALPRGAAAAVG